MYEQKDSLQSKKLSGVKNDALGWWDMPKLRKRVKTNSKIKQQQTATTNTNNYIKKFMSVFKKKT